jgi:hypothetical protein
MIGVREGIALIVLAVAFGLPFLTASGVFTDEIANFESRGAAITFLLFGLALPFVVGFSGSMCAVIGWRRHRRVTSKSAVIEEHVAADGFRASSALLSWPFVIALAVGATFVGSFGYGGGEAFAMPENSRLAVRIARHWLRCDKSGVNVEYASIIAMEPIVAKDCISCLDDRVACDEQPLCDAPCHLSTTTQSLAEFGGTADTRLFGTWDAAESDGVHLQLILRLEGYELSATSSLGRQVKRGRWAAILEGTTWKMMLEPEDVPDSRSINDYAMEGPDALRWTDPVSGASLVWRRALNVAAPLPPATPSNPEPSAERVDACNRACRPFRECVRDLEDVELCADDLTRTCRECRAEGLGRGRRR